MAFCGVSRTLRAESGTRTCLSDYLPVLQLCAGGAMRTDGHPDLEAALAPVPHDVRGESR